MKTKPNRILSIFMSILMVFMCMTSTSIQATSQKMTLKFNTLSVSAGQDIQFDIITAGDVKAIKEITNAVITIPDGFTVTGMSDTSPAFNGTINHTLNGQYLNFSIASNGTIGDSDVVASIYMHVNENNEQKNYMFQWTTNAVSCILADGSSYTPQFNFGMITVGEGGSIQTTTTSTPTTTTTATSTTTTTTTTTTAKTHTYSIYFVDEETNQGVSGIKYGISTYIAGNNSSIDNSIKISDSERYYFESELDRLSISLTIDNPIPDGYYIPDGATYWEVSANNPDLTVYLRKVETTTNTETTTTTEITTTTTITTKYTYSVRFVDEETEQIISGVRYVIVSYDLAHDLACPIQTSGDTPKSYEFISDTAYVALPTTHEQTIADSYYVADGAERWELSAENPDLTVYLRKAENSTTTETTMTTATTTTETTTTTENINIGDVNDDGLINSVDASLVLIEYALLSTKDGIGEFTPEQNTIADLNKDGKINAVDASLIAMYYAYLSTEIEKPKDSIDIWLSYSVTE